MNATILHIDRKVKRRELDAAGIDDFQCRPIASVDARTALDNEPFTLYCLDPAGGRAVFVKTSPELNLDREPFYYVAQYRHAELLMTVSFADFHLLAGEQRDSFENLILIFSVGRCGSTLLSQAFSMLDSVQSLSEPDVFTNISGLRRPDGGNDEELTRLLQSSVRLTFRPRRREATTLAIKFRSQTLGMAFLLHLVFPSAKALFLYRNAESWAQSYVRAFGFPLPPARMAEPDAPFLPAELLARHWASLIHRYEALSGSLPMLGLRYETLLAEPTEALRAVFEYCGLPQTEVPKAEAAFARDSQRGTSLARDILIRRNAAQLTPEHIEQIRGVLGSDPSIRNSDFVAAKTVTVYRP